MTFDLIQRFSAQTGALLAAVLLTAASLSAQSFRGQVVDDSTQRPLENARIILLDAKGVEVGKPPARSDSAGRFVLHAGEKGKYRLQVSRIGYQALTTDVVDFFGGEYATLTVRMSAIQQRLGTVVVTEKRRYNRDELMSLVGFELRKSKGDGRFMDTMDLATYRTYPLSWMLHDHAGLGLNQDLRFYTARGSCAPEVWLDSWRVGMWVLGALGADEIHGVEVYNGISLPPPSIGGEIGAESSLLPAMRRCGAIVVWTKAFARQQAEKARKKG